MNGDSWAPGDPPPEGTTCLEWHRLTQKGYGIAFLDGRAMSAHRMAASMFFGPEAIVDRDVMHLCENKACWNPLHLRPGTRQENQLDWMTKRSRRALGESVPRSAT